MEMETEQVEQAVLTLDSQAAMAAATEGSHAVMAAAAAAAEGCGEIQVTGSPPHELIKTAADGHLQDVVVTHLQQPIIPLAEGSNGAAGSSTASADGGGVMFRAADAMEGGKAKECEEEECVFQISKALGQNGMNEVKGGAALGLPHLHHATNGGAKDKTTLAESL